MKHCVILSRTRELGNRKYIEHSFIKGIDAFALRREYSSINEVMRENENYLDQNNYSKVLDFVEIE